MVSRESFIDFLNRAVETGLLTPEQREKIEEYYNYLREKRDNAKDTREYWKWSNKAEDFSNEVILKAVSPEGMTDAWIRLNTRIEEE